MSAFDYARSKATADRLIARFGQAGTLRRPTSTGAAYNPTPGAPEDHAVTIVVLDYKDTEVDGTRIRATDKRVLLARSDLAIAPALSDQLFIGYEPHALIEVQPLSPGGTVLMWELQARR